LTHEENVQMMSSTSSSIWEDVVSHSPSRQYPH